MATWIIWLTADGHPWLLQRELPANPDLAASPALLAEVVRRYGSFNEELRLHEEQGADSGTK